MERKSKEKEADRERNRKTETDDMIYLDHESPGPDGQRVLPCPGTRAVSYGHGQGTYGNFLLIKQLHT